MPANDRYLPNRTTPASTDEFECYDSVTGRTFGQTRSQIHTLQSGETLDTSAGTTTVGAVTGTSFAGAVAATTLTASSTAAITGVTTPTGGIAAAGGFAVNPTTVHTGNAPPSVNTDGSDATPVVTEIYISELFVPCNMSVTGISVFNGSVASDDWHRALLDSDGALVTGSATGAVTSSGADAYQRVPFTGGAITVNLIAAATAINRMFNIKKLDGTANAVTVDGNASETIDGDATYALGLKYESITIHCDGTAYWVL